MNITGMVPSPLGRSTYADDPATLGRRPVVGLIFVSLISAAVSPGTTAGVLIDPAALRPAESKTDAGLVDPADHIDQAERENAAALTELRQLTGLTWDQIATLFGVSRRAVHFWANGKPMAAAHQEHLARSLTCMKAVDKGNTPANRQALFAADVRGVAPFDLLMRSQYEEFVTTMGLRRAEEATSIRRPTYVGAERRPIAPNVLASAIEEPAQRVAAPARRVRVNRA